MLKKLPTIIFSCFLISNLSVAHADQLDRGIGLYIDQDMFVPFSNEDRDYTMGIAVEFFWEKERGLYPLDNMVRRLGKVLGLKDSGNSIVYSFMLGTVVFTPDDLANPLPIFDDRPYSSLIYLSNKRVYADNQKAIAAEVSLGLLGTGVTEFVQTHLHSTYRSLSGEDEPVDPQGWSHQISDGGELTLRLRLSSSQLHPNLSNAGVWDLTTSYGLSLGYQTNVSAGIAIRAGNIESAFWSLPFDPVNRGNFLPSSAKREWYLWSAFRAHLVGYDALLQGQFRDSHVQFSSDQIERLIYDGAIGLTLGFKQSQFTISANAKSSELKITSRKQIWGSINMLFHF